MSNHRTLLQDMKRGINCRLEAIAAIESLEAEVEEQARLLGASGSREAELLARVEALREANRQLHGELATLLTRIEALESLLRDVHDDLLLRAVTDTQGHKVVAVGFSIWERMKKLLEQEGGE